MIVGAVVVALMLGYLGGLVSFKVKSRWCPECGATTARLKQRRQVAASK
jgi:hypothetical protein